MPFGSNDIEEESAVNSILITPPKNKELLNALNTGTIRRRLQCEGADMDTFFHLKNNYKRASKTTLNKLLLLNWNNVVYD